MERGSEGARNKVRKRKRERDRRGKRGVGWC